MFQRFSERITDLVLTNEDNLQEDRAIYQYGIQQGLILLLNFSTTLVIGLIFRMPLESILFLTFYMPLRSFAGGYHAKTAVRCYIFSIVMMTAVLWAMRLVTYSGLVCSCLGLIAGIIIWMLAPVENQNKPLDDIETKVYRNRARSILLVECTVFLFAVIGNMEQLAMCIVMVFCTLAMMLLLGKGKYVNEKEKMKKGEENI